MVQDKYHSWIRFEDDDDSSFDIIATSGEIPIGDIYCGHRHVIYFSISSVAFRFA